MALFGRNDLVQAQQQTAQAQQQPAADSGSPDQLQEVVVSGLRYSVERSLDIKKQAVGTIDVVTAESIGKLPDKNVADALQRLPGVDISSASGNEGAFDEADRVSMRGTSPSLTQTTINGHYVATGDWFILDQTGTVGRSVSYTLLPAELVKEVRVYKSQEASLLEGGTSGSVDIITRKPLDFHKSITLQASVGAVYATNPGTKDPQFSFLGNWINGDHTFGVMAQLFSETRHLRRDGQEILGYSTISPTLNNPNTSAGQPPTIPNPIVTAFPQTANAAYPTLIGATLFQQKRVRNGGLIDAEWQPNDSLVVDFNGFASKLQADNLNDNYLLWGSQFIGGENQVPSSVTVQNGTVVAGAWAPVAGNTYTIYDQISRPGASSDTYYGTLSGTWKPSGSLTLYGELGDATGDGRSPHQDVSETTPAVGTGAFYRMNGTVTAVSWGTPGFNQTTPTPNGVPVAFSFIFGDQNVDVVDAERWAKIDATYAMSAGVLTDLKAGVRFSDHDRHSWGVIGQGVLPNAGSTTYPTGFSNYPSDFGNGIGSGFPQEIWYWSASQLAAYDNQFANRDPVSRHDWTAEFGVHEKVTSAYVQADFAGDHWSANAGVRFARTQDTVAVNTGVPVDQNGVPANPAAITTSLFGAYVVNTIPNNYNNVLPSANFKYNLTQNLIGRFDVSETMTRPDYSSLAGSITATVLPTGPGVCCGSASGGNPNLKPTKSTNVDAGIEWYFAPKSLLAAEVYYMALRDYVAFNTFQTTIFTQNQANPAGFQGLYTVTAPQNANARVQGLELSYTQSFFQYWGVEANYTYADGKQTSNIPAPNSSNIAAAATDQMVGTSKSTANAILFFENRGFSARVAYTYRSSFFDGLDRASAFFQNGVGSLAASIDYQINDSLEVSLDGLNLNNPEYKYFASATQPRSFYRNGSQYYLNLRFQF